MHSFNHPTQTLSILLLLSLIIIGTVCDCPITRYRPQIKTGQIKVTQTQLDETQVVQTIYYHPLDTPLSKSNPTVIIGLTGYSYTGTGGNVWFQILHKPSLDLSALRFQVHSKGTIENQRIFSFKFMSIEKDFLQIQAGTYTGHPTLNPVPANFALNSPSINLNTQVVIFLNGFKGTNLIDNWNLQLSTPRIESGQLKYDFISNLASNQVESISYSYLLYNKVEYSAQNEVFLQPLKFSTVPSMRLRFNSLQFTDSTFFGLSMISFVPNVVHSIDMILDDKSSIDVGLMIESNLNSLNFEVFIWQSFVKQSFVCSFCKDGSILYDSRYCVIQCPGDFIPQQGQFLTECQKCSIQDIRVLDPVNRRCICAIQYFDKFGSCTPCHYSCLTCVGQSNIDCLTCDVSSPKFTFRQLIKTNANSLSGKCACPVNGFYEEDLNIRCLSCNPDCKTCTGSTETQCLECNKERTKNDLGMCVCKTGYTSQADGSCGCLNPRYEVSGSCINPLNSCGLNEIQVVQNLKTNNGNSNNNGKGNNKNTTPTTTTTKACECRAGFARVKGQCLACGPNQEYNDKKGICQCVKSAVKHKTQGCIVCSADKRYDKDTESCICKSKNQFMDNKGNCISCPQKSVFYQDQCYCINNYFMNDKKKCQKCKKKSDNPQCKRYGVNPSDS